MTDFSHWRLAARTCVVDADAMVENYYRTPEAEAYAEPLARAWDPAARI